MTAGGFVAVIDHGRQRGALAGTGGAHHEHEATLFHHQIGQHGRHIQRIERWNVARDVADHHGHLAALAKRADAEVAQRFQGHRHVEFAGFLQLFHAGGGNDFREQVARSLGRQHLAVDRDGLAVDLDHGRRMRRQVHVRGLFLGHQAQDALHCSAAHVVPFPCGSRNVELSREGGRSGWSWSGSARPPS
ncbi:hypothetical protein FQZ97_1013810 [compost metagenome]